jgi:molydopterin dinucleotide binding protein
MIQQFILNILPDLMFLEDGAVKTNSKALNNIDIILKIAKGITAIEGKFSWSDSSELKEKNGNYEAVKIDFNFQMDKLKKDFADLKNMSGNKLSLVPLELQNVGDGEGLKFPYVNKLLDGETYSSGKLWVQINSSTAVKYGISRGDKISIKAGDNKIGNVKVLITDIIAPDTIAIPLGFGQIANTKFAKNKGVNPKKIMTDKIDPLTGAANWFITEVEIS